MNPNVCRRCAETTATCCRLMPGQEKFCFPVSDEEKQAILAAVPDADGVFVEEDNDGQFLGHLRDMFSRDRKFINELFPEGGKHLRLATREDGSCIFLTETGCLLSRDARPYFCRLFPMWVSGSSGIRVFSNKNCQAQKEATSFSNMMHILDMDEFEIKYLYKSLRRAWGLPEE